MSQEIEQFETHMDRMDREAQQQRANLAVEQERTKRAKIEAKANRQESWQIFIIGFFVSAVVLGIAAAIFFGVRGPSAEQQQMQDRVMACYDQGKDWIPEQSTGADGVVIVEAHCETAEDK